MPLALLLIILFLSPLISIQSLSLYAQEMVPSKEYDLHISKGIIELEAKRYESAKGELEMALSERPNDPDANYYLGLTYLGLNDETKAEGIFKKVVEVDPSYPGAGFQLGVIAYKKGAYSDAKDLFFRAEKIEPDHGMIYYYLGLIHHREGNYDKTPPLFLKAMSLTSEVSLPGHYYSGLAYYKRGIFDEAEEEFLEAVKLEPESDIARSSKEYIEEIERARKGPKRYNLSLSLSEQYDSNVVLEPTQSILAAQITRNQDSRSVAFLQSGYRIINKETFNLGTGYSLYLGTHKKLSDFNTISHDLSLYGEYGSDRYQLRLQYDLNYILVGDKRYLLSDNINPIINIAYGDRYITQASYRYQLKDFHDTDRFPTNSDRDGKNNLIGLTQFAFFSDKKGNIRIGYSYDSDSTSGPDWDYNGHRGLLGLGLPLIEEIKLDLLLEYNLKRYKNPNSLSPSGEKREDREDRYKTYTIGISKGFKDFLQLSIQYLYTKNDSNIPIFEYDRSIYSLTATGRW